jgi:hypothetical protein
MDSHHRDIPVLRAVLRLEKPVKSLSADDADDADDKQIE